MQKAEKSAMESNRAVAVATNLEIRRSKARLMEELPKLRKLAQKKVSENGLGFRIFIFSISMFIVYQCLYQLYVIWQASLMTFNLGSLFRHYEKQNAHTNINECYCI